MGAFERRDVGSKAPIFAGGWTECGDGATWSEGGFFVTVLGCARVVGIVTINRGLEYVAVGDTPEGKGWAERFVCCRA